MKRRVSRGEPYPLGVRSNQRGTNFALFSASAERVELCLFDGHGNEQRINMDHRTDDIWHAFIDGVAPGQVYGYRLHGPWDPARGQRFNPAKVMLDPYARVLTGPLNIKPGHYDYHLNEAGELQRDTTDNAREVPLAVVHDVIDRPPRRMKRARWSEMILYEMHVKGFTVGHPAIPPLARGRYAGLAQAEVTDYLRSLGITTVELLPVQAFVDEPFLTDLGLTNYWGYNPICFFAPTERYALNNPRQEFVDMVRALHKANIEVILDVVYNHTGESNHLGPSLSMRGIDNAAYYRLDQDNPAHYINDSGCGNSLNLAHPATLRLVMDSLRFWVRDMGVDGFRFDLATSLARGPSGFSTESSFFSVIQQDPILSRARLIAEPWDLGPGGYQLGQFPKGWSEWNDQYRDTIRRFWRGDQGMLPDLARQVHGASDLFEDKGRTPQAGINFITSHDGFTLSDLVSYESKHNEANLENNQDGNNSNYSFNCGVEGETDLPAVNRLRIKQRRNLIMTLMFSHGVPMLLAGDELGRTKAGNNNSYCQDNEINHIDWRALEREEVRQFHTFVARAIELRRRLPELRCERFIHGVQYANYTGLDEIEWYHPSGEPMVEANWQDPALATLGLMLHGAEIFREDHLSSNLVLVLFNARDIPVPFHLPRVPLVGSWQGIMTSAMDGDHEGQRVETLAQIVLEEKSVSLFVFAQEEAL